MILPGVPQNNCLVMVVAEVLSTWKAAFQLDTCDSKISLTSVSPEIQNCIFSTQDNVRVCWQ